MEPVCITIECLDPESLASFWDRAIGGLGVEPGGDGASAICRPADGVPYLEFVRVPEAEAGKNRLHLGCSAGALRDLDAEVARLVGIGASVAWEEEFPPDVASRYRNLVLRDPEGNEFCLGAGDPTGI